jgi:hypothetical protein
VLIGVSPQGEDADSLRKKGRDAEARAVVDEAVSGGVFLAMELLRLLDLQGTDAAISRGRIWRQIPKLIPDSKLAFQLYYKRLGMEAEDTRVAAMRMASNLAMDGVSMDQCLKAVRDRYDLDVSVSSVAEQDQA